MWLKKLILVLMILVLVKSWALVSQTVKDADGNNYLTVSIGKQVWFGENLRSAKFNDGKSIQLVTVDKAWKELKTPGYCFYDNDPENKSDYGALYNWYAVSTGKLCPSGWHVPSLSEWATLAEFLGDVKTAGDKLKEKGTAHWKNFMSTATNDYDFTALPGGMRYYSGAFPEFGNSYAVWWSSTEYSTTHAWTRGLWDSSSELFKGYDDKHSGYSVRCIKDQSH